MSRSLLKGVRNNSLKGFLNSSYSSDHKILEYSNRKLFNNIPIVADDVKRLNNIGLLSPASSKNKKSIHRNRLNQGFFRKISKENPDKNVLNEIEKKSRPKMKIMKPFRVASSDYFQDDNPKLCGPYSTINNSKKLSEICFIGRSNVGKSSLLNCFGTLLTKTNTENNQNSPIRKRKEEIVTIYSKVADRPGQTRALYFREVHLNGSPQFRIVDMPGYGFSFGNENQRSKWPDLILNYLKYSNSYFTARKIVVVLLDARTGMKYSDKEFIEILEQLRINFILVLTKCDLISNPEVIARNIKVIEKVC